MNFFFDLDMLKNIIAELFGIALTVLVVDRLLTYHENKQERTKWRATRQRVGARVGWAHTILKDKLNESPKNAYEIFYDWCNATLEATKQTKQQYSYAFTAEMAGHLEEYEEEVNQ